MDVEAPGGFDGLYGSPMDTSRLYESPYSPYSPSALSMEDAGLSDVENIRVVCRFRPTSDIEQALGGENVISYGDDNRVVSIKAEGGVKTFQFSHVFNEFSSQEEVYTYSSKPMVQDVLNGRSASIIAYGQTGAGKTYTMQGPGFDDPQLRERGYEGLAGIIPRVMQDLFNAISGASADVHYEVSASYLEIYQEKIRDLLEPGRKDPLPLREGGKKGGLVVPTAKQVPVYSSEEIIRIMQQGARARVTAATNANDESSRSHTIFLVTVTQNNSKGTKYAQLYLVDLAGSEKVSKTLAEGQRLSEAKYINKSLLSLGNVIEALVKKKKHIPYRDSKLTRLLKNSLGGNAKTTLIINCSPSSYNAHETLSTLRFGDRTSRITNVIKINEHRSVEVLEALLAEKEQENEEQKKYIMYLEAELARLNGKNSSDDEDSPKEKEREKGKEKMKYDPDDSDASGYAFETPKQSRVVGKVAFVEDGTPLRPAALFKGGGKEGNGNGYAAYPSPATEPVLRKQLLGEKPTFFTPKGKTKNGRRATVGGEIDVATSYAGGRDYFLELKAQMDREQLKFRRETSKKDMLNFLCPITRMVFKDPVVCMDGHTYERDAVELWLKRHSKSPLTGKKLPSKMLIPNYSMKKMLAFKRQLDISFSVFDFFSLLPLEIVVHIFTFLDYMSLVKCELVCVCFRDALQYDGLWKSMLVRDFKEKTEAQVIAPRTLRDYYTSKLMVQFKERDKNKKHVSRGITLFKT